MSQSIKALQAMLTEGITLTEAASRFGISRAAVSKAKLHPSKKREMTQTIEQLTARVRELELIVALKDDAIAERTVKVRELEEEKKQLEDDCGYQMQWKREFREQLEYSQKQLASAQLQIKQLREAAKMAVEMIETNAHERRHVRLKLNDAISLPTDTEALDAYVSEKVKEATLPVADELQAGRLQWMVRETAAEEKVTTLTRQRDLAVEALEWIASSLPQIGVERVWMLDHAIKTLLAAIKESEGK